MIPEVVKRERGEGAAAVKVTTGATAEGSLEGATNVHMRVLESLLHRFAFILLCASCAAGVRHRNSGHSTRGVGAAWLQGVYLRSWC